MGKVSHDDVAKQVAVEQARYQGQGKPVWFILGVVADKLNVSEKYVAEVIEVRALDLARQCHDFISKRKFKEVVNDGK